MRQQTKDWRSDMHAACYVGDKTLKVIEHEPRSPARGEVAIDVAYTGICGTDLHIVHGAMDARVSLPAVLGHEMSGTISAVGDGVEGWSAGDRVTVMPLAWCGHCPACRAGHHHICHNLDFLGIDSPGSMQASWTVSQDVLVSLPPTLSLQASALAEPTAVAVHDVRRAGLRDGERTLVVGGGPIGILIACVARASGADVLVLELSEPRRAFAETLGLRVLDPTAGDVQALVGDWTEDAGADVAFEVSGAIAGIETAIQSLAVRGRLVMVAIHATPPPVNLFRVFWRELTLVGARVYERSDFEEAVRLLDTGAVPAAQLITRIEPLGEVAAAFTELESGRAMKMLIDCQAG
jgi:(R,R)-butanediol dehydrogenase / meso-butanediol dehydrogenase / diacetyl reductase